MTTKDERERDAKLVQEYHEKSLKRGNGITQQQATAQDIEHYQQLQHWFMAKHHCLWMSCIKEERSK